MSHEYFGYSRVIIIHDNCAIHKIKTTKSEFQKMSYSVLYLPAFSSDFASVKIWFGIIKQNLSENWDRETKKVTLHQNYSKIYDALASIKLDTVRKIIAEYLRQIKQYL